MMMLRYTGLICAISLFSSAQASLDPNSPLPPNWEEAEAPDGKTYYWHTKTHETKWKRPRGIPLNLEQLRHRSRGFLAAFRLYIGQIRKFQKKNSPEKVWVHNGSEVTIPSEATYSNSGMTVTAKFDANGKYYTGTFDAGKTKITWNDNDVWTLKEDVAALKRKLNRLLDGESLHLELNLTRLTWRSVAFLDAIFDYANKTYHLIRTGMTLQQQEDKQQGTEQQGGMKIPTAPAYEGSIPTAPAYEGSSSSYERDYRFTQFDLQNCYTCSCGCGKETPCQGGALLQRIKGSVRRRRLATLAARFERHLRQ